MARVSKAIPSLFNGVSQQAPTMRLHSQGELQVNGLSSLVNGVMKRPPTFHIARLDISPEKVWFHAINRDASEKYGVVVNDGDLKVYALIDIVNGGSVVYHSGQEVPVSFPDGKTYLESASPSLDFTAVTVADFTFIVNRQKTAAMDETEPPETPHKKIIAWVSRGLAGKYTLTLDGVAHSYKTDDVDTTTWSSENILAELGKAIVEPAATYTGDGVTKAFKVKPGSGPVFMEVLVKVDGYGQEQPWTSSESPLGWSNLTAWVPVPFTMPDPNTVVMGSRQAVASIDTVVDPSTGQTSHQITYETQTAPFAGQRVRVYHETSSGYRVTNYGDSIVIERTDGLEMTVSTKDPAGGDSLKAIQGTAKKFSDLPSVCEPGLRVRIAGSTERGEDDYYVVYASQGNTSGVWRETRGWNLQNRLKASTMPHKLVREADGTFTFRKADWAERSVGDGTTAEEPSFTGRKLTDIFFYRNRLGLVADENVVLSRAGEFFNFWPETVRDALDSDPIDVAVSHSKVALISAAVAFQDNLLLFSENAQFNLSGGDVLTQKTAKLTVTTEFASSSMVKPVASGSNVFFVVPRGAYSGLREYYVDPETATNDAADVTAHVPAYLPGQVFRLTASTNEDILLALSEQHPDKLYVYKYYWSGDEKVQSSWSHWEFGEDSRILGVELLNHVAYLLIQRGTTGVFLEALDLDAGRKDAGLDFLVHLDRRVTLRGAYDIDSGKTSWTLPYATSAPVFVTAGGLPLNTKTTAAFLVDPSDPYKWYARGDFSAYDVYVGERYALRYRFSEQFMRQGREGTEAVTNCRLQLRTWAVNYTDSGDFQVEVSIEGREPYVYPFKGRIGTSSLILGRVVLSSGSFRFPVMSQSTRVSVSITNDSHLPSNFQSAEWDADYVILSRRV